MNDKPITVRPHFLYVFTLLYPYLTLLIIPVIRGVFRHLTDKSSTLSTFFAAEVIMLSIAFFAAVMKLRCTRVTFDRDIKVEKGLFCRVKYTIPNAASQVIMLEQNPFFKPFGVYRLKIYTEAGVRRRPDESIPIGKRSAEALYKKYTVIGSRVKSNTLGSILLSAALSSSTAGVLLAAPAVKVVASLLGEGVSSLLPKVRSVNIDVEWIDAAGKVLPLVIIAGYIVSFAVILLRNIGFTSARSEDKIMLDSGFLPHRTAFLRSRSVNAVKMVTAPLMLLAGKCAVKFSACGFGRNKGEIGLLVPCVKRSMAKGLVRWLLPQFVESKTTIRPERKAVGRCFALPTVCAAVTVFVARSVELLAPQFKSVVWTVAAVGFMMILMWLAVRILVLFKGYFSFDDKRLCIRYQYGFGTAELQTSAENVEYIRLSQTPFDILHGQCTVKIKTANKNRDTARLKYVNYREAKEMLELNVSFY